MDEAGTLQHVRDFTGLLADVRRLAGRVVTFVLIHHENRAGTVSGAWEGAVDTLLHVQAQGHGQTRVHVQKARWSSTHHKTSLQLAWADGEGFELVDAAAERTDENLADEVLAYVLENGGTSWRKVEKPVGGNGERLRSVRDRLLAGGRLYDAGGKSGMKLWHVDDPARPTSQYELCPTPDTLGTHPASGTGENGPSGTVSPCPDVVGTRGTGTQWAPPDEDDELRWSALLENPEPEYEETAL